MQRVLEKMARQLNAYDEASLMQMWQHYALQVNDFEPTKRWEEAAIALCLIQAVHWKNQLFNFNLASTARPGTLEEPLPLPEMFLRKQKASSSDEETPTKNKATVLHFPTKES